jgi:hypothetical protein
MDSYQYNELLLDSYFMLNCIDAEFADYCYLLCEILVKFNTSLLVIPLLFMLCEIYSSLLVFISILFS